MHKIFRLMPAPQCHFFILTIAVLYSPKSARAANPFIPRKSPGTGKLPDVSSTLLKLHEIYIRHPPHDTALYQTLRVSPNATTIEIQKSYRKVSRLYHPDKQRRNPNYNQEECAKDLERIQKAYEVLKEDATRLPYHKYGLVDLSTAVLLLTGYEMSPKIPTVEEIELMHLMGLFQQPSLKQPTYPPPPPPRLGEPQAQPQQSATSNERNEERVQFLAATILERIRPLVEQTLTEQTLADFMATECDRLKRLPLGANILRCVGRAYRHAGQRYLRAAKNKPRQLWPMRDTWHDAKHVATALVASGRVALKENWLLKSTKQHEKQKNNNKSKKPAIAYHWEGELGGIFGDEEDDGFLPLADDSDAEEGALTNEELQQEEALKSEKVMVQLLQVEALWKVHKIGLNRAVKDACDLILSGQYFFFPSHQSAQPWQEQQGVDGWVSAGNRQRASSVIDANEGKLRAAAALVLIGDIMVQSSKDGTAWME